METQKDRFLNVPATTKFEPSADAFEAAGMTIHGRKENPHWAATIQIEAPNGGSAYGGGVVGFIKDRDGKNIAEYSMELGRMSSKGTIKLVEEN